MTRCWGAQANPTSFANPLRGNFASPSLHTARFRDKSWMRRLLDSVARTFRIFLRAIGRRLPLQFHITAGQNNSDPWFAARATIRQSEFAQSAGAQQRRQGYGA